MVAKDQMAKDQQDEGFDKDDCQRIGNRHHLHPSDKSVGGGDEKHRPRGQKGGVAQWDWDGDRERPTFRPSINCGGGWHGYIEKGRSEGARLLIGGSRVTDGDYAKGAYVAPTVFTDCRDDMTIVREEIFGPVMSILIYDSEEEVIRRANDTDYGLAAGVVTRDLNRAHRVIHKLEAGICWINTWGESPAEMPVGGYKQSGVGRENGLTTLAHYTRIKSVQVELGGYTSVF